MAKSFALPFDLNKVDKKVSDLVHRLPNSTVRYPEIPVIWLTAKITNTTDFKVSSPVTGAVRAVEITGGMSANRLLEIAPLPFPIANRVKAFQPGLPTFYLAYQTTAVVSELDNRFLKAGAEIDTYNPGGDNLIYFGVVFQNRVAFSPWAWIEMVRSAAAMDPVDSEAETAWRELARLYTTPSATPSFRALDARGSTLSGATFKIQVVKQEDNSILGEWEVNINSADAIGDLEAVLRGRSDLPKRKDGVTPASMVPKTGEVTKVILSKKEKGGVYIDAVLPFHVLLENGKSSAPGKELIIEPGITRGHIQATELGSWFSANKASSSPIISYATNSRLQYFVDGEACFKALYDDLQAVNKAGQGAHFAGWEFQRLSLRPGLTEADGTPIDTSLVGLTERYREFGGDIRVLATRLVNFQEGVTSGVAAMAFVILIIAVGGLVIYGKLSKQRPIGKAGFIVVGGGFVIAEAVLVATIASGSTWITDLISILVENSGDMVEELNAIEPSKKIALWCSHPAGIFDNPLQLVTPVPDFLPDIKIGGRSLQEVTINEIVKSLGTWHQKLQLIKRSPDPNIAPLNGREHDFVAYAGSIDIAPGYMETPGHNGKSFDADPLVRAELAPVHAVHARITGPGAFPVFKTWQQRYDFERGLDENKDAPDPVFPLPDADKDFPPQAARHIVQIGRTSFKPGSTSPDANRTAYARTFEPDTTINDTLLQAIASAREYIYIEDQYFTPNSTDAPAKAEQVYANVLIEAAKHCQRLVIVLPTATDQAFGNPRRRELFGHLKEAWGNGERIVIGTPIRRPYLHPAGFGHNQGRCVLMEDVGKDLKDTTIVLGPTLRVTGNGPFWLWADGELMLAYGRPIPITGRDEVRVDVKRGEYGATRRAHKKGAAVTLTQLKGIYILSKLMIVDDIFVSIGSANICRRSLFYDGELNAFAIPEQLKAAPENPARQLRTALWAEHLGLPPAMGAALLEDPLAAFTLFRRSRYQGNRFTSFGDLDPEADLAASLDGDSLFWIVVSDLLLFLKAITFKGVWNLGSDPTGLLDPAPASGPIGPYPEP